MEIMVTNDDGIFAEGLRVLALSLKKLGHVTVVAPDRERSATGHAITVHHPLRVEEVRLPGSDDITAYAVNGTPSDCVKLGVEALLSAPPDLVVSGINPEPNLGTDVLYSGTVSAAMEGIMAGIPSLAVSLAGETGGDMTHAAEFAAKVAHLVSDGGFPPELLLNINVPSLEPQAIVGVKLTRLGVRRYRKSFDQRVDPRGKVYFWLAGEVYDSDEDPDTDTVAIRNNFISVTPLHADLTRYDILDQLKKVDFSALK